MPLDAATTSLPPAPPSTGNFKRHEGRAPFFMPSAPYLDRYTTEIWRGMITIRYEVMCLWDPDYLTVTNRDDPLLIDNLIARGHSLIRSARVGSETYAEWLRRWHPADEILPHIQWGGHIQATPDGDGGRGYAEWVACARTLQ